jgi:glycosyltransferase involved in cell wall biosynthesis
VNVIIVTSSYPLHPDDSAAAAGLFVRDFALLAAGRGHRVRVVTQDRAGENQTDPSVEVIRFPWRGNQPLSTLSLLKPSDLLSIWSLFKNGSAALDRAAAQDPPDLIIAMWILPAGLLARRVRRRRRIPYRVWVLGSDIWTYGRNPLTRWIVRRVLRDAEKIYADGRQLAEDARRLSGVTCRFLPSSRNLPAGAQRPPELDQKKKNYLFIGRFHRNKGVDLLLEAIGRLDAGQRSRSHFYLFGGGPQEEFVRGCIGKMDLHDSVSLMGYADCRRAAAFLEHCHFLIIPSRIESIPIILSDAASARCPVLVTNVGDMGSIVGEYNNGIVVSPDPHSLKAGIQDTLDRDRQMFLEGSERVAREFSLESSLQRSLE